MKYTSDDWTKLSAEEKETLINIYYKGNAFSVTTSDMLTANRIGKLFEPTTITKALDGKIANIEWIFDLQKNREAIKKILSINILS